jgi:hypothetical protein
VHPFGREIMRNHTSDPDLESSFLIW